MTKKITGWDYLSYALLAFGGLGLEALLAFVLEPALYGASMNEWTTLQNILHWIITCILWGMVSIWLIKAAKKNYQFDLFARQNPLQLWQWIVIAVFIILSLIISYYDWNGSKVIREFRANGWLKFIFQYIYYIFETALVTLILVFGQKAFDQWFTKKNIPYGGILAGLTWGLAHIFTKGSLSTGLLCAFSGFAFGSVYLLTNRDIRKTFPIVFIMFVL